MDARVFYESLEKKIYMIFCAMLWYCLHSYLRYHEEDPNTLLLLIIFILPIIVAGSAGKINSTNRSAAFLKGSILAIIVGLIWLSIRDWFETKIVVEILNRHKPLISLNVMIEQNQLKDYQSYAMWFLIIINGALGGISGLVSWWKSPQEYYLIGISQFNNQQYIDAKSSFEKAIQRNLGFAEAYYQRGLAYIKLEALDSARKDFIRAGELGVNDAYDALKEMNQTKSV